MDLNTSSIPSDPGHEDSLDEASVSRAQESELLQRESSRLEAATRSRAKVSLATSIATRKPPCRSIVCTIILSLLASHLLLASCTNEQNNDVNLRIDRQQQPNQPPSQLFLPTSGAKANISLVGGVNPKRQQEDEEAEGFVMQANNESTSVTLPERTTTVVTEIGDETTTIMPTTYTPTDEELEANGRSSGEVAASTVTANDQEQQIGSDQIPIDANRKQYLTHDQLSLLNASTKDENIPLSSQQSSQEQQQQASSRAGMSRVSHVSSFLSDLFSYATKATRPLEDRGTSAALGHQNYQSPVYTTTSSSNQKRQQTTSNQPIPCPGVCRSFLTASVLCRNEQINAACPSILQRCCDKDDVSFDGTPVETSAPILDPNPDNSPPPTAADVSQGQESSPGDHKAIAQSATVTPSPPTATPSLPAAAAATTTNIPATGTSRGDAKISAPKPAAAATPDWSQQSGQESGAQAKPAAEPQAPPAAGQPQADLLQLAGSGPIYFLSSGSGESPAVEPSGNHRSQQQSQLAAKHQAPDSAGQLAQSANGNSGELPKIQPSAAAPSEISRPSQSHNTKPNPASQSFDLPVSSEAPPTVSPTPANRVVVLHTANGPLLHQPTERPPVRRPAFANWTDYQLLLMAQGHQLRPQQSNSQVVYHSNTDPVKKLQQQLDGNTTQPRPPNDLSQQNLCPGACIPKSHAEALCRQTGDQSHTCADDYKFCCLKLRRASQDDQQVTSIEQRNEPQGQLTVLNDQHSNRRASGRPTTTSTTSTTTTTTTTTTTPPTTTTTTTTQPTTTSAPDTITTTTSSTQTLASEGHSVGNVIVDLLDSWVGSGLLSSSSSTTDQANNPASEQKSSTEATGMGGVMIDPSEDSRLPEEANAPQATNQVTSFADVNQPAPAQNDRRLGLDLTFRQQQQPQPNDLNANFSSTSSSEQPTGDLDGLMTSDGSSEQEPSGGNRCNGYCTIPLFTMLCDSSHETPDCGANKKCCIMNALGGGGASDQMSSSGSSSVGTQEDTRQSAATCRGSCLRVYHSNLCAKPRELQVDSPGCLPDYVCCAHPNGADPSSQFDEQLNEPQNGHNGLSAESSLMIPSHSSPLDSALLPPPPPALQPLDSNQMIQEKSNRVDPTLSLRNQQRQGQPMAGANGKMGDQQQSVGGGIGSGFMNQIYQMFKSNGIVGGSLTKNQRQKQQTQMLAQPNLMVPTNQQVLMAQMGYPDQAAAMQLYQQQLQAQASLQRPVALAPVAGQVQGSQLMLAPQGQSQVMAPQPVGPVAQNPYFYSNLSPQQQQFIDQTQYLQAIQHQHHHHQQQQQQQKTFNQIKPQQQPQYFAHPSEQTPVQLPQQQVSQIQPQSHQIRPQSQPMNNNNGNMRQQQQQYSSFPSNGANNYHEWRQPQQVAPQQQQFSYNSANRFNGQSIQQNQQQLLFAASDATKTSSNPIQSPAARQPQQVGSFVAHSAGGSGQQPATVLEHQLPAKQEPRQQQQQQQQQPLGGNNRPASDQLAASSKGQQSLVRQQQQQIVAQVAQKVAPLPIVNHERQQHQQQSNQQQQIVTIPQQHQQVAAIASPQRQPVAAPPANPNNLASSSSNLNIHFTSGPAFVDLQRVEGSSASTGGGGQRRKPSASSSLPAQPSGPFNFPTETLNGQQHKSSAASAVASSIAKTAAADLLTQSNQRPLGAQTPPTIVAVPPVAAVDSKLDSIGSPGVSLAEQVDASDSVSAENSDQQPDLPSSGPLDSTSGTALVEDPPTQPPRDKVISLACGLPGPKRIKASRGSRQGRVMGGTDAQAGYWCWQAALMNNKNEYLCGGALIGPKWVLTAAHCVTQHLRSESPLYVRLGQTNLNSSSQASEHRGAKTIQVKTSYVHHNHNGITLDNDVALLRLEEAADLSEPAICSVCLPEKSSRPASLEPGKRCTVTGYGFEDEQGPAALRVRQTELPIVGDAECQNKTSQALGKTFSLPANSFCAGGEPGRDACHGDGGSPLSCLDDDGSYELTGIVSWGYKCGSKDLPGLYSKVSAFVGWINQIVSVNN